MENTRKRVQLVEHKGRGRPQGSLSKIAQEAREKAQATGQLPHEFLLSIARGEIIYRDIVLPNGQLDKIEEVYDFDARRDAAKAAAPYYAPKISTVEVISGVPDAELDLIIAQLASEAGLNTGASGEDAESEGEADAA
jgi:hypothetical protein